MTTSSRRRRNQRGSTIVESAFIFLVFASMLIGIVDFGQFLFIHTTLTERAREGVRWAIVNDPTNTTAIQNVVLYGQSSGGSVPTSPTSSDKGIFNVQRSNITVATAGSTTDDYRISVKITGYSYAIYSPYIAGNYTGPNIVAAQSLGINF